VTRSLVSTVVALALALGAAPTALAQEKPAPAPPAQQGGPMVPLKLDLVISRLAGDKKISSMPYSMWLTANDPSTGRLGGTSLRMGVRMPLPATVTSKEGAMVSYTTQYHDIGTNIDASAVSATDGRFGVSITLNESGVNTKGESAVAGAPMLRNFTSRFFLLLSDGQTAIYTSATDPVTGETLNVQVTLTVLK
jgi:hypothetical protein